MSKQVNNIEPLALSITDAAASAGVSRSLVYKEMAAGRLASIKIRRRRLIPLDALHKWLSAARLLVNADTGSLEP